MAKSTIWYILRKKEHAWQQKKVADDRRILSIVKKNPFTTSSQEVGVSLSKSTIKRRLHDSKYRRFTTRYKPIMNLKTRKARLDSCTRMIGRKKYGEGLGQLKI